ncbi:MULTISPECIES: GAF domain-containing protein [unclassified Bradyrhizobium]|uniref:GAF domain-containing protein n=1 Tax=unclassified Bradyrhizobium TaxID=2631580 RepID=UPI001FF840FB|nr:MULTISPECIES: GAF domain-containing protein [unclassified Bradyrhizobium]MCK1302060.1 GAF domain-containing protein [Bradyrhizobium sp. 37]MCK1774244.1 GAF domain-containing protein [Bradyrhizobium sp. 134]
MNKVDQVDDRELQALRRALSDMAALSSLPAMWVNADEERIGASLADALMRVLDLDGVRVSFATEPGKTLEVNRLPDNGLAELLQATFPAPGAGASCDLGPHGGLRAFCTAIGLTGAGRLDAVSARRSFPSQAEHLALTMAANQVAIALQRARAERALRTETDALNRERHAVNVLNRKLGSERDKLQRLFEQAPGFMAVMRGPEHIFELCNQSYFRLIGDRDILGRPVRNAFPELEGQGFFEALDTAYTTGAPYVSTAAAIDLQREPSGPLERRYLDFIYQPIFDENGEITGIFAEGHDVTKQIQGQAQLAINEESIRLATSAADVGIWDLDLTSEHLTWCDRTKAMFGISPGMPCSMADFYGGLHPEDLEPTSAAFASAIDPQRRATYDVEYRTIGKEDGITRWVAAKGKGLFEGERCVRAIGTAIDITARKAAEQALRRTENELRAETRALQILNRAGALVAANLDLAEVVQTITDAGVELTGAGFGAFFYNVLNESGESYTLYTLSGAPREAFSKFPMPRNTAIFAPTFNGEGTVRSDDILKDPRYGHNAPRKGMPDGHLPVRSYLAVPVRSRSGEVLGGLFFGHPEPGVFNARSEELMTGLAGQASVAIDNARLFQASQREIAHRKSAEEMLQQLNATLEERVAEEMARRGKAEDALRQAQKMEAVGQLTGGVAHDFNNLLTIIIGGLDTIRRSKPGDETRVRRAAEMSLQGAQRAASLTARLLAFSRRQPLTPQPSDLNLIIRNMTDLFHRTLGETIELEGVLAPRLWTVDVDPNQVESAILNLGINSRDAMPQGGRLTIETANVFLDEQYAATEAEVVPGQYVMVSVSDTGSGMDRETLGRVFEPFFTTKEVGKGTGLGLSMVYGFVKQSGGHVAIYSEPGTGTSVKMYFPRYQGKAESGTEIQAALAPRGHSEEVILVVEDNDDVRAYSVSVLAEMGYSVLEAQDPEAALSILRRPDRIDLLFTDVVLPGRSGRELADLAGQLRPGLKVLFTTGYSRNAIVHHGRLDAGVQLIIKPFTFEGLAARVRDVLDAG